MTYDQTTNVYCAIAFAATVVGGLALVFAVKRIKSFMDWLQSL